MRHQRRQVPIILKPNASSNIGHPIDADLGLREALAACRNGDTLVAEKFARLGRPVHVAIDKQSCRQLGAATHVDHPVADFSGAVGRDIKFVEAKEYEPPLQ